MTRVLIAALCLCPAVTARADDPLPRYRLTPGREIAYESKSSFQYGKGKSAGEHRSRQEWTGWVLRANPDGSSRLLIRDVSHFVQVRDGKAGEDQPRTQVVYADIFPDGRILPNPTIRYRGEPTNFFPRLPKNAAEAKAGWENTHADAKTVAKSVAGDGVRFTTIKSDAMDKIYLSSSTATYTFDPARGLIAKAETESTQGYGFEGKGTGTIELTGEKTLPPADLSKLAADADRYFAATQSYDDILSAAGKLPPDQAKASLAKAIEGLKVSAGGVTQPDLKTALADRVKEHDRMAKYTLDDAERRAKFIGQPAFAVDATDLDGKPVKLADLKGKVVVLDFWYRGCGWCVKAMPQMNQLTSDFAGEPVAVVGMNTDAKQADAELVIKEMDLKYRTLRIKHAEADKFGVQGFPTLVLIDKKGVVRDLHVGYSPTLREDVGKAVRGLLAEKEGE